MTVKQAQYKKLIRRYEKIKDANIQNQKKRIDEVYNKIPRIINIDEHLSNIGIKMSKAVLLNPQKASDIIQQIQNTANKLQCEKDALLIQYGYSSDYMDIHYRCDKCKDTGFIESNPCNCFKQQLINLAYEQSNLKHVLSFENFEYFRFDYYSDTINPSTGKSPMDNMKRLYRIAVKFVNIFGESFQNLLFYGPTGLGKTFLCNCIAKDLLDNGYTVLYLTSFQLFQMFEQNRFRREETNESTRYFLDSLFTVDLLIIDDLGSELNTALTGSELFNCLNNRLLNRKATIISTNLTPNEWRNNYSDRIVSRIFGNYTTLKVFGDDVRLLKKYQEGANVSMD